MYARKDIIKALLVAVGLLVASCREDVPTDMVGTGVPIAFDCRVDMETTRGANGTTGFISSENGHLLYAGFGVFAQEEGASSFDFMTNQKVEYTFLANDPGDLYDGYWSYQPLKYWPYRYDDVQEKNVPKALHFCAYAPYVDRPADDFKDDPTNTGIVGMSAPNAAVPAIVYARGKSLEENVDLLWTYVEADDAKAVTLQMHHALARVSVGVTMTSKVSSIEKVLIERITLKGNFAKRGTLELNHGGSDDETPVWTPVWKEWVLANPSDPDNGDNTIIIDCNPATTADDAPYLPSYGIVAESVRYITGLPERWQPAGLQVGTPVNVLTQDDDQPTYLLLIPQEELTVTAHLQLHVFYNDDTPEATVNRTGDAVVVGSPLDGNVPYKLNLQVGM